MHPSPLQRLAATEVGYCGTITTISTEHPSFWEGLLPKNGENLLSFWDDDTNKKMDGFLKEIFLVAFPKEFSLAINAHLIQFTGCRQSTEKAFIYWKYIEPTEIKTTSLQSEPFEIVDISFKHGNFPMALLKRDGSIIDANDAAIALLGYPYEEYKNLAVFDINPTFDEAKWANRWEEIKANSNSLFITKLKRKDGSFVDIEVRAKIVNYKNTEITCSSYIDITDNKKIKTQLELVDYSFKNISNPIVFVQKDGSFYYFNEATSSLLGYTMEEFRHLTVYDINLNFDREVWANRWKEIRQNRNLSIITKLKKKDGTWLDIEVRTNALHFGELELNCAFYTDITEKKKVEERLKLVDFIFKHANISIFITQEDGHFYDVNEAAHIQLGYTKDELMAMTLHELDPAYNPEVWSAHWKELQISRSASILTKHKKKDGTLTDVYIKVRLIKYNDLELNCAFVSDITEKKKAETEKEQLLNELIESNKELVQFSYIISHNLRAPLTNLIAICKKIDTKLVEDEQTKRLIEGFKQSTMLLNDTLTDLIMILIIKENRHIVITKSVFGEIFNKVRNSISSILLKQAVTIEADFSEVDSVDFSDVYLESVFLNLLTNAIKYSSPSRYPIIKIKTFEDANGKTKLTFSDNGLGMNMARVKHKIFGLYQRFHNNPDGKGIGLYLVHSQVTALGCTIEVESEEGVGTKFTITFK